jgi:hypoxanthine-guanine phosphoribosyltransferase
MYAATMDDGTSINGDPRHEIERLEAQIDALSDKIESCRKFILASRIAVIGGGIVFAAMLIGAIRFDPAAMALAIAAMLGGVAVWGSNGSTAREAAAQLKAAEGRRIALIGMIELRVIDAGETLH